MAASGLKVTPSLRVQLRSGSDRVSCAKVKVHSVGARCAKPLTTCHLKNAMQLVADQKVKTVEANQVSEWLSQGYKILDIRPEWEFENGHPSDCVNVPLFVEDTATDPSSLLKKWVVAGYGGLWQGNRLTKENEEFPQQVKEALDMDAKVIVSCAEGLRSLCGAEVLHEMGYSNVAWLKGGYVTVTREDIPNQEGNVEVQYAGIGGVSRVFFDLAMKIKGEDPYLQNAMNN